MVAFFCIQQFCGGSSTTATSPTTPRRNSHYSTPLSTTVTVTATATLDMRLQLQHFYYIYNYHYHLYYYF